MLTELEITIDQSLWFSAFGSWRSKKQNNTQFSDPSGIYWYNITSYDTDFGNPNVTQLLRKTDLR